MAVVIFSILPLMISSNQVSDAVATFYFSGLLANLLLLVSESVNLVITPDTFLIFISFYAFGNLLYIANWCLNWFRHPSVKQSTQMLNKANVEPTEPSI